MFYSTITDSTVVSSDLISQPISFSNVNTKGDAEPLAVSSTHLMLLMHNCLPWKEARKGKQQAIILTPVSPNWNPLTISPDDRGWGDVGPFIPQALFLHAALSVPICMKTWVCITIKRFCALGLHKHSSQTSARGWDFKSMRDFKKNQITVNYS